MLSLMAISALRIGRHDKVLYSLCNVRRDMMEYLRLNCESISREDYISLRSSLDLLNHSVHYFGDYKRHVWDIKNLIRLILIAKANIDTVKALPISKNPGIVKLITNFEKTFLIAFFVFTPLLKTKIFGGLAVFILWVIYRALIKFGSKQAALILQTMTGIKAIEARAAVLAI
jgi:hypothetical protein